MKHNYILIKNFPGNPLPIGSIIEFIDDENHWVSRQDNSNFGNTEWSTKYFETNNGEFFKIYKEEDTISRLVVASRIGQEILDKFFKLSNAEIKEIVYEYLPKFETDSTVSRTTISGTPKEIRLNNYDSVVIDINGIFLVPEHGLGEYIVRFNKHFKI